MVSRTGVVIGFGLALACSRSLDALPTGAVPADERATLDALLSEAGVAPASVRYLEHLDDLPWRGADRRHRRSGDSDGAVMARKHQDDASNAVVVEGGHVVGLRLGHTRLTNLVTVSKLIELVVLDLHDSKIAQAEGLGALPHLEHLDLAANQLTSMVGIARLPNLHSLYLGDNPIATVDGLDGLPELEVLSLSHTSLASAAGFGKLPHLRVLSLEGNAIDRFDGLEEVSELEELNLSFCQLTTLDDVGRLAHVRWLQLWGNRIHRLHGVDKLPGLQYLGLGENPYDWNDPDNQAIMSDWAPGKLVALL